MVRQNKDGMYHVECSHCKKPSSRSSDLIDSAIFFAEEAGFITIGKFQFCGDCFTDMMSRWTGRVGQSCGGSGGDLQYGAGGGFNICNCCGTPLHLSQRGVSVSCSSCGNRKVGDVVGNCNA